MNKVILVTGSAGFIGTNFVREWLSTSPDNIVSLDKLTYAGNLENLVGLDQQRHAFVKGDIGDTVLLAMLLKEHKPRAVINFAAESHVDRSIHDPEDFIQTNVVGTFHLLQQTLEYWENLDPIDKNQFRFLHVSTDEVYGSLSESDPASAETKAYQPNNPYAASKAAADHLVRAYNHTYGLPVLTINCSNNYGPYQFPEKLIPLMILNALSGKPMPIYGDGNNVRDWLYVGDHCMAIRELLKRGRIGETYNIGGWNQKTNLEVVNIICSILDEICPAQNNMPYASLITYVKDRPGHDRRYAIDARKIKKELGWKPLETFDTGMRKTVKWYVENTKWMQNITSGAYKTWVDKNYAGRRTP